MTAAGALAAVGLHIWDPAGSNFEVCIYRSALDLPCPGCGLTRAASHLTRGSFAVAVDLHPMAPLLALEAAFGWLAWGVLGRERLAELLSRHVELLVISNAVPFVAIWLGRAATGTLPF